MPTPLNASASTAGALFGSSSFSVPDYQREYAWTGEEVAQFWNDFKNNLHTPSYFLGLIILASDEDRSYVVDGQQRIVTLSLLAAAIRQESLSRGRKALADIVESTFLKVVSYKTDERLARTELIDSDDNATFLRIINSDTSNITPQLDDAEANDGISPRLWASYQLLRNNLRAHISSDPFQLLGTWVEFITEKLYFAIFNHPDKETAYKVFEVINDRGRDLTTADLLKNYVLSQSGTERERVYNDWKALSGDFGTDGSNNIVQFIRHVVTSRSGYVLPSELYSFVSGASDRGSKPRPRPLELVEHMKAAAPLYEQMVDPSREGPGSADEVGSYQVLNDLSVITVRPILLALHDVPNSDEGVDYLLRLVVRRVVVGSLGTGNIERRFGDVARQIRETTDWRVLSRDLMDLNPPREDFIEQLRKRSMSKATLSFLRRSIVQNTIYPHSIGTLHFIQTKKSLQDEMGDETHSRWVSTIGNTFLADIDRRPPSIEDWSDFKAEMINHAVPGEWTEHMWDNANWSVSEIQDFGEALATAAADIWYPAGG